MMQNPINTPREFFDRIVEPDCQDVFQNPDDVRCVFHAATSLNHLKEWLFKAGITGFPTPEAFNADVNMKCPELRVIRELAGNAKHFPPGGVEKMEFGVSAMPSGYGMGGYGTGGYGRSHEDMVIAKADSGRTEVPQKVIRTALLFWRAEFQSKGW